MKVLIVCTFRSYAPDGIAPFIKEQVDCARQCGVDFEYYIVRNKGIQGYIKEMPTLKRVIYSVQPDIIHAHYGLCGLFVNLTAKFFCIRHIPIITTYHGSDINETKNLKLSRFSIRWSTWNIFISNKLANIAHARDKYTVIPCGVNTNIFYPRDKTECRRYFGWNEHRKYILFSKAFHVWVKNYPLAKAAIDIIQSIGIDVELVELKGFSRDEVAMLMNACDCALMTSFTEGSPQFIKEAMACNCPIVTTNVGDVEDVLRNVKNCYICGYSSTEIADCIMTILQIEQRNMQESTRVRDLFSNEIITSKLLTIYQNMLS